MNISAKIYIAGHRGMVGSAILKILRGLGYTNIITRTHSELDLTRQRDVENFFSEERPDYVFLAAARVGGIMANNTYRADFIYENMMIAANVIHASYRSGVRKLLNLGSSCIYPKFAPQPLREDYLLTGSLEPTNEPYAIAKISAIKLCRYYNEQYNTNFISVMPANLYGLNDNYDLESSHVLPALIRKFHLATLLQRNDYETIIADFKHHGITYGKNLEAITRDDIITILHNYRIHEQYVILWGSGDPYREFLYASDLAEACVFLMQEYDAKEIGELVNIGTGSDVKIRDLACMVKEIIGFTGELKWDTSKPDGTPRKLLDVERVNKLGWKAKTDLATGIRTSYQDYNKLHLQD